MYIAIIVLTLLNTVNTDTVCEPCVCFYENKIQTDYQGENVDCSRKYLLQDYELPNTVYKLDLTFNNVTQVFKTSLLKSETMKVLLLNNNKITNITKNALQLPNLEKLDLSYNLLEYLHEDTFICIRKLKYLNLANNRFTSFTKLTFHYLTELNEINIDNNYIGPSLESSNLFDRSGYGLTNSIKTISICGIGLDYVPDNFFIDAYDIRKIVIANNSIKDIFELPFTLEYLDLSDNPIEEIESEDFVDLAFFKVLKLNNIGINEVPPYAFAYLTSLKELELERNKNLTEFSRLAFGKPNPMDFVLERLSLKGSRLSSLDQELMELFGLLTHLDLQGNPWKCDCNIVWIKQLQITEKYYDHLRCATPKSLFNARIFDLNSKYFVCPPHRHTVGITVTVVSVCITLSLVALWLFVFVPKRHQRSDWLRMMYTPSTAYTMSPIPTTIMDN